MKKSLHEKFKNKINFVKPLYRRGKSERGSNKIISLKRGDEFDVMPVLTGSNIINVRSKINREYRITLPGSRESDKCKGVNVLRGNKDGNLSNVLPGAHKYKTVADCKFQENARGVDKHKHRLIERSRTSNLDVARDGTKIIIHETPETWLRVYPAPKITGETTYSVIIRCVVCQLGLTSFLVLWTIIGVFIVQSFEGPQEVKMAAEFAKEQNQLVIDLATELRQISPLSPKWKNAIERRIEDERKLTMGAIEQGAMKQGLFWNLSSTFLFAIQVMSTLGFGAPIPLTIWGRVWALIYTILAVPTHIYLIINASTCAVINLEACLQSLKTILRRKMSIESNKTELRMTKESLNKVNASKANGKSIKKEINACLGKCSLGHVMPFTILLYYILGVLTFGVLRNKDTMESILFPMEFTLTGGLEHVESYIRILYGLYMEGAVFLLACTVMLIQRYSRDTLKIFAANYRLFAPDRCRECQKSFN